MSQRRNFGGDRQPLPQLSSNPPKELNIHDPNSPHFGGWLFHRTEEELREMRSRRPDPLSLRPRRKEKYDPFPEPTDGIRGTRSSDDEDTEKEEETEEEESDDYEGYDGDGRALTEKRSKHPLYPRRRGRKPHSRRARQDGGSRPPRARPYGAPHQQAREPPVSAVFEPLTRPILHFLKKQLGVPLREVSDIGKRGWRPTRLRLYPYWPREDKELEDEWYEKLYEKLWQRVWGVSENYFGGFNFKDAAVYLEEPTNGGTRKGEVWRLPFGSSTGGAGFKEGGKLVGGEGFDEEFRWFVQQVAVQDNNVAGWDGLLLIGALREALVAGIIFKVLEIGVFDELLFGGDENQKKALQAQDEYLIEHDGYQRTYLRSQNVRPLLAGDRLTPYFWRDVDRLTVQLTALLVPLFRLVDWYFGEAASNRELRDLHQKLHEIVAEAAFLSLGIRWSRNIFYFKWPVPGEVWEIDQDPVNVASFRLSEKLSNQADNQRLKRLKEEVRMHWARLDLREQREHSHSFPDWLAVKKQDLIDWFNNYSPPTETDLKWKPHRMAKVQIACRPTLQRFFPAGSLDEKTGLADHEGITTLANSKVIHYYGVAKDSVRAGRDGLDDRQPTLDEWLKQTEGWWWLWPGNWRKPTQQEIIYFLAGWLFLEFVGLVLFPPLGWLLRLIRSATWSIIEATFRTAWFILDDFWSVVVKQTIRQAAGKANEKVQDATRNLLWRRTAEPESSGWLNFVPGAVKNAAKVLGWSSATPTDGGWTPMAYWED